jgi:hypothetical protein
MKRWLFTRIFEVKNELIFSLVDTLLYIVTSFY